MSEPIRHASDQQRFELEIDGNPCRLHYTLSGNIVSLDSVQVPKAVGGQGIAGRLTRHALDWARQQNLRVRPVCPYVAAWIKRHPEYADLLA
ncbi:MAG: N-acetyltransferase [Wenzhouxiangella sp.]|nr:MAG: N-acetyltransferase [Wenzhouxiangella sp.]